jgi:nucleoid-associated protein YgaU
MPATAAIVQPGGVPSGQPTFHRSLSPVAALLEPIEAVAPEAESADEPGGGFSPSAATPDGYVTHTVSDGDTLTRLAAQYLGSAERYLEIYEANRDLLASPDLLPIGKMLKIPRGQAEAPATERAPTANDDPSLRLVPLSH